MYGGCRHQSGSEIKLFRFKNKILLHLATLTFPFQKPGDTLGKNGETISILGFSGTKMDLGWKLQNSESSSIR